MRFNQHYHKQTVFFGFFFKAGKGIGRELSRDCEVRRPCWTTHALPELLCIRLARVLSDEAGVYEMLSGADALSRRESTAFAGIGPAEKTCCEKKFRNALTPCVHVWGRGGRKRVLHPRAGMLPTELLKENRVPGPGVAGSDRVETASEFA